MPVHPTAIRHWPAVMGVALLLGVTSWAVTRYASPRGGLRVGARPPAVRVRNLVTGDSVALDSAYAGHVTLINIWATTCVPCRKEMPSLERLYRADSARGLRIAAVSVDDGVPASVLTFAHDLGLTFDILQDRTDSIEERYQTVGIPQSVLIDRHGRIAYVSLGASVWDSAASRQQVERALAEQH
ncbi:MAG TPA: TlpA disulfide reductase family protein [Gemmatimonadales bacterium]|nr:TlpA disulfide reductase family protein [Gemmatimonadales bacterium]